MTYPLPGFVSSTLAAQPVAPRQVSLLSVVRAVFGGVDCAIYVVAALVLIAFGVDAMTRALLGLGLVLVGLGIACGLLAVFRVWQVASALRRGVAQLAEVIEAEVGRARIYGTPWGEPMGNRMQPIAAEGSYRVMGTGETGRYYMQQNWATSLRPGARIWVLRHGRNIIYAPV